MPELTTLLSNSHYPLFRLIHDCVDTGADFALTANTPATYPCDCALRDYKSDTTKTLFSAGLIKDSIPNAILSIKFRGVINGPINTLLVIRLSVPHPTLGDIPVDELTFTLGKNNVDQAFSLSTEVYNSSDADAHIYGFDVEIETSQNTTLKARSVYVRT